MRGFDIKRLYYQREQAKPTPTGPVLSINPSSYIKSGTYGVVFVPLDLGANVTVTNPIAGEEVSYSAVGLPAGVSISSAGVISGSPQVTGTIVSTVTISYLGATPITATITFNIAAISASALASAINEHIYANTGTSGTYTGEEGASVLRAAAISAIEGYAKGNVASDGTYTAYDSSNHEIPAAEETGEWYSAAYWIVYGAKYKYGGIILATKRYRGSGSGSAANEADAKTAAEAAWTETSDSWGSDIEYAAGSSDPTGFTVEKGGYTYDDYGTWWGHLASQTYRIRAKLSGGALNIQRTVYIYYSAEKYGNYDFYGLYNIPEGTTAQMGKNPMVVDSGVAPTASMFKLYHPEMSWDTYMATMKYKRTVIQYSFHSYI